MTLREARLTGSEEPDVAGGGIPLPVAYQVMLEHLLNNDRRAPASELEKLVRNALEIKTQRVLRVWGSWAAFVEDAMTWLETKGKAYQDRDDWVLSRHIGSGTRLYLPGDARVVIRDKKDRDSLELYARARRRCLDYRHALEQLGLLQGDVEVTLDAHLDSLHYKEGALKNTDLVKPVVRRKPVRPHEAGAIVRFTVTYARSRPGEWFTVRELIDAFNAEHPPPEGSKGIGSSTPHGKLKELIEQGYMERTTTRSSKNRPMMLYRWIKGPDDLVGGI